MLYKYLMYLFISALHYRTHHAVIENSVEFLRNLFLTRLKQFKCSLASSSSLTMPLLTTVCSQQDVVISFVSVCSQDGIVLSFVFPNVLSIGTLILNILTTSVSSSDFLFSLPLNNNNNKNNHKYMCIELLKNKYPNIHMYS